MRGTAQSLSNSACTTSEGEVIQFDVVAIATGHKYPVFMPDPSKEATKAERIAAIEEFYKKVSTAKVIVLSGGGPIGSEAASDIKLRHKNARYHF